METKVYEIEIHGEKCTSINIRAYTARGAKQVAKRLTKCLMRDMKITRILDINEIALNDNIYKRFIKGMEE